MMLRCGYAIHPPPTPACLTANRARAQKSRGPRMPEGQGRVALSACLHPANAPHFLPALGKASRTWQETALEG